MKAAQEFARRNAGARPKTHLGCWRVAMLMPLTALTAHGQDALQTLQANAAAAEARDQEMQAPQDYTFKKGDFRLMITPSVGAEWIDNVNLSSSDPQDDYILTPAIGVTASYPLSKRNLLYLSITAGYDCYVKHPQYDALDLNSSTGTGLSFDVAIKDVTINFHDRMSYAQGVSEFSGGVNGGNGMAGNPAFASVANSPGSATFGTFQNTAGVNGVWDLDQVKWTLGYDHENVLATSSDFDGLDHSSEVISTEAKFMVHPKVNVGMNATAAYTMYDQSELNNNAAYTVGPFVELHPGHYFSVTLSGGYSTYEFQQTSTAIQTSSLDSWYVGLRLQHQPTDFLTYGLNVGRDVQLGIVSDLVQDWYVRPNATWKVIKGLAVVTYFFYDHTDQGVGSTGSLPGYNNGTFDWYGGGLSLQHPLTSRLDLSLSYQFSMLASGTVNSGYTQNLVALQLTYHPK